MRWIIAIALIVAGWVLWLFGVMDSTDPRGGTLLGGWEAFGGIGIGLLGVGWLVYLLACAVGEFISWASGNR